MGDDMEIETFSCTAQGTGVLGNTLVKIDSPDNWELLVDEPKEDGGNKCCPEPDAVLQRKPGSLPERASCHRGGGGNGHQDREDRVQVQFRAEPRRLRG